MRPAGRDFLMSSVNDRLFELGIELPAPLKPGFEYVPVTLHGNIAYVSGQLPRLDAQTVISGKGRTPFVVAPRSHFTGKLGDLTAVATALGLAAHRVSDRDTFSVALSRFLSRPAPTLIESMVDPTGHARLLADLEDRP